MESSFEERDFERKPTCDSSELDDRCTRFELLSAYLDGEVTAAERKQVQEWLDTDPQTQKLYTRLLRLHQELDNLPVPPVSPSSVQLSEQVFGHIDRDRRSKRLLIWGGAAIAAVVVGALSNLFLGNNAPVPQIAETPLAPIEEDSEQLTIALNHPIVEIPAAAILPSEQSQKSTQK